MVKNFVLLGPPGVGKGTIASQIAKEKGIIHISTGHIFRENIKNKSKLGLKIKAILATGKYVPDDITNPIVAEVLHQNQIKKNGFILDGYPRTINQVKFLNSIVNKKNLKVILLKAKESILLNRLAKRSKEENRKDDAQQVIKKRINIYNQKTAPLIDYYQKNHQLIIFNAEGKIEENIKNFYRKCFIENF